VNVPVETISPVIRTGDAAPAVISVNTVTPALPEVSWWQIAVVVWLAGMIIAFAYHFIRHCRFMKTVRRWSEEITDEQVLTLFHGLKTEMGITKRIGLYLCPSVGSPMIAGLIKPRILLPVKDLAQDDFRFILGHELIHYKRKDLYYKCLVLLATCMHWFNPIVYMIAKAINAGCELSCDAELVRSTGIDTRRHYSEAIIGAARYQSKLKTALSTNFYGGKKVLRRRIFSIMDMSKKKAGAVIICAALIVTVGTGFAFAATAKAAPTQKTNYDSSDSAAHWESESEYIKTLSATLQDSIKPYKHLGVSVDTSIGLIMHEGRPVREIYDDVTGVFIAETMGPVGFVGREVSGAVDLTVLYEDGKPSGFHVSTQEEYDRRTEEREERKSLTLQQASPGIASNVTTGLIDDTYQYEDRFAVYAKYGLNYDQAADRLSYKNELVRYFEDMYPIDDNSYAGLDYFNENGTIDVHAVRDMSQIIYYADGGYDPSGKLIAVEPYSQAEFDARDIDKLINPVQNAAQSESISGSSARPNGTAGQTVAQAAESGTRLTPDEYAEMYSVYEPFGVTYDKVEDRFYYDGKLVREFLDIFISNGESLSGGKFKGSMMSRNEDDGEIDIETVRDYTVLDENGYGKLIDIVVVVD
jgi:beta-lactamase regulating signal transducer with metallopeptidase domain